MGNCSLGRFQRTMTAWRKDGPGPVVRPAGEQAPDPPRRTDRSLQRGADDFDRPVHPVLPIGSRRRGPPSCRCSRGRSRRSGATTASIPAITICHANVGQLVAWNQSGGRPPPVSRPNSFPRNGSAARHAVGRPRPPSARRSAAPASPGRLSTFLDRCCQPSRLHRRPLTPTGTTGGQWSVVGRSGARGAFAPLTAGAGFGEGRTRIGIPDPRNRIPT